MLMTNQPPPFTNLMLFYNSILLEITLEPPQNKKQNRLFLGLLLLQTGSLFLKPFLNIENCLIINTVHGGGPSLLHPTAYFVATCMITPLPFTHTKLRKKSK